MVPDKTEPAEIEPERERERGGTEKEVFRIVENGEGGKRRVV